ncbi:MAG: ubiquinol oxidase subunit II [Thermomonas sp.]
MMVMRNSRTICYAAAGRQAVALNRNCLRWIAPCAASLLLAACSGTTHLSFLSAQGPIADAQRWHFYWVTALLAVLVAGPIFLLLPFWAWRYRYDRKDGKYSPHWRFSRLLEITAWGGPIIIVAILAFFVWRDAHRLDPYRPIESDQVALRVQVIGYDWNWMFIYPDQGIASIGTLAIPVGRPVTLHLTSATVMQSLFIPALGSQIYAMGGMVSQLNLEASKPGLSLGENTMYNGDGFHQQKFIAQAMSPEDFDIWVANARAHGMPLNASTLGVIALPSTRKKLTAALPMARASDGSLYFTGVSKRLFAGVVKATMDGTTELPQEVFVPAPAVVQVKASPAIPMTEQTP